MIKKRLNADSVVGISILIIAFGFIAKSLQFDGVAKDGIPGAGYFPIFAASFMAIFAILLIIDGIKKQNIYFKIEDEKKKNLLQMVEVYGALIAFFILWNFIPFVLAALFLEIALCKILKCSWKFTIIFSIAVVVFLYLIFNTAFKVKLDIY